MKEDIKNEIPTGHNLWQQVSTTNPKYTKKVNQRGGFTAINATYQLEQATIVWGSYGSTWGVKDCNYQYIKDAKGNIVEIVLEAVFYYPGGEFELSTDATYKPGQDCRKKTLTDLTTKALSKLGFSADVFLGMYDDNKYINSVKAMYQKPAQPASVRGAGLKKANANPVAFDKIVKRIKAGEYGLIETSRNFFNFTEAQSKQLAALAKQSA